LAKNHVLVLVLAYDKIIAIDIYLNVNIETQLLISGYKKIKLFVIPVKEVKLVRPLIIYKSKVLFGRSIETLM
jgi:hypothetical protein